MVAEAERALEALRRSEHNFRTLIERSPLPTCVSTVAKLLYANQAMIEYLGYDADTALLGPSLAELSDVLIHPDDRDRTRTAFASLFAGLERNGACNDVVRIDEVRIRSRRDGAVRFCDMHGVIILHDGAPALVTYLHDHTERRAAAEHVRLADRMSALGMLAAGVAHEINNPLTYVITNVELLANQLERTTDVAELIGDTRGGLDRIRNIVRALKTFSRADDETIAPADVVEVVESSIAMAHTHLRHHGRLVKRFAAVPPVRGNAARLGQVFVNLLLNAAQALTATRFEHNEVVVTIERSGDHAIVEVSDNGCGIAPADVPRVFDAFFTTKPVGIGTGLGLFVCHGIVTALGGTITVDSVEGQGTRVRVALPLADTRRESVAVSPAPVRASQRGRVLVIDDEPLVLNAVRRLLDSEHDVTTLATGEEALERLLGGAQFDVVLCDLMMPGLRGDELFAHVEAKLPAVAARMIFMTGGAVTDLAATFAESAITIEKPFDAAALLALVRTHLTLR